MTILQNIHVLQEKQANGKAVIVCTANGQPVTMVNNPNNRKQILVPVKKGCVVLIGKVTAAGDEILVLQVSSLRLCKGRRCFATTELLNRFCDGKWQNTLPVTFYEARDVLIKKMHSPTEVVFALSPVLLSVRESQNGYPVLDEECGAVRSTIVCRPDETPAKAIYVYPKPRGESGKQAVVEIAPRYRVLRGKRTESGYEIDIYVIERLSYLYLSGQRVAEAALVNRCIDGRWQREISTKMRPLITTLIDKIEETDTETIVSKMR